MEMADSILLHNLDVLKDDLKREYTELGVTLNYLFRVSELGKTLSVDETLKEYGGALELVEMEKEGACFLAKLRR